MWGFFKKKVDSEDEEIPPKLKAFLDKADSLYSFAFKTRDILKLKPYLTRNCCIEVSRVVARDGATRYLANGDFRKTQWKLVEGEIDKDIKVKKSVVFDTIKISSSKRMKVASDYEEIWSVDSKLPIVTDIDYLEE